METLHIYTRVSSGKQLEGYSPEQQKETGIVIAKRYNMLYEIHDEGAESSKYEDLVNRPVLTNIMNQIKENKIKHLFVKYQDRLSRNEFLSAKIKWELKTNKVTLYTLEGIYDFSKDTDTFMYSILAAAAEYDNALRTKRFQAGIVKAVEKGKWQGSLIYGYERDENSLLKIYEPEAIIVRSVYQMYLAGAGVDKIAMELNGKGIRSKTGKNISNTNVARILRNSIYIGKRLYKGQVFISPQIIAEDDFIRVQEMIKGKVQYSNAKQKYFYLLRGLIKCNRCQRNYIGEERFNRYKCYSEKHNGRHDWCGNKPINKTRLDYIVWYAVKHTILFSKALHIKLKEDFDNLPKLRPQIEKEIDKLKRQLTELNNKRNTVTQLFINDKIDTDYLNKQLDGIVTLIKSHDQQLTEKEEQLTNLQEGDSKSQELINRLDKLIDIGHTTDDLQRREIICNLVSHVTIDYDKINNLHLITIVFKNPSFNTTVTGDGTDVKSGRSILTDILIDNPGLHLDDITDDNFTNSITTLKSTHTGEGAGG